MPNWREPTETDLAASLAQDEIDAFRASGPADGSDPVASLLFSTASMVRGWIASGGRCAKWGPGWSIPAGLMIPAMDYAMAKVLNRQNIPLTEDRRNALKSAEETFAKLAAGAIGVEPYAEEGEEDDTAQDVAGSPAFGEAHPTRLLD